MFAAIESFLNHNFDKLMEIKNSISLANPEESKERGSHLDQV